MTVRFLMLKTGRMIMNNNIEQQIAQLSPAKRAILEQRLQQKVVKAHTQIEPLGHTGPLSFAQQRMWFIDQLEPGNPVYNRPTCFRLVGVLNIEALTQSLHEVVHRHGVLRSHFPLINGQPSLNIIPKLQLPLSVTDLSQNELQTQLCQEAQKPFDLAQGPLIRARLFKLDKTEHYLLITLHHSVFDGWSETILKQELASLYQAFSTGQPSPLPTLPIQYGDYAHWQRQQLDQSASQLAYWKAQLAGELPILELPTDRLRPSHPSVLGATHVLLLPQSLTDALKTLSQREGGTLFMTLLSAFKVLLHRYTGQKDVIVGTPVAGRDLIETESLIGIFINTLALRTTVADNLTFQTLLSQVRKTVLDAFAHQAVPFEQVVEAVQPERNQSQSPIFQILFQLRNLPKKESQLADLTIETTKIDWQAAPFELTLDIVESPDGLLCQFQYRTELFAPSTIDRMAGHFHTLLEGIVANPTQTVGTLPLLTPKEQHQLLVEWNNTQTDYPQDKCIHQLFEAQVERTPDAVAVVFENERLTYQELNIKASQLAHYLQTLGVTSGKLVGLGLHRSLEMVISLLAILKAGGAYVPLDPNYPSERLAWMIEDSNISVLLTTHQAADSFATVKSSLGTVCYLETSFATFDLNQEINLTHTATATDLAYVIYTSGSTGKPKGVEICHRSVTNFLQSMAKRPGLTAQDAVLSLTTLSFDIAVLELLLPLSVGAQVILVSREVASDGAQLLATL
ncbi:MAG: condensation domain-containing protein, partial [Cyanobacteria bacterium P01_D01_bin.56]